MEVKTSKQALEINQTIGRRTDTIIAEEDFVVPDIKPDILSVVATSGMICIYKKEIMEGKIRIDGCVNTYIMYITDDENSNLRSLNMLLDFSKTIDIENISNECMLEDNAILKSLECRVLNGRKVNIKAIIDLDLKLISNKELELITEVKEINDVEMLNKVISLSSTLGTGMTKVYAKDTIIIDNADNLSEIMKVDFKIKNAETKVSYNKVLVKADACVKIMYLTEDNRIGIVGQTIPVMGFIDMQDVSDENLCDIKFELKNLLTKPNSVEEHSIYVEAEIEIKCSVYQSKEMNIIKDLYSPSVNLLYKQKEIETVAKKEIIKNTFQIREKESITEIGNRKNI